MTELYVDPDGLTAVSEVAHRQHEHVGRVSDYISSTCSQFGAFSGVLNIFEGSYRTAVETALDGMRDGQTLATKLQTTVKQCSEGYVETDHEAYDAFKKLLGTQEGFPAYHAPGSGNSTPGGPERDPEPPAEDPEDNNIKLKKLPEFIRDPLDRAMPGPETADLPPGADPKDALKNHLLDSHREDRFNDAYLHYREQGMTPDEARDAAHAKTDDATVQGNARADAVQEGRTRDAADRAYDDAIANGKTPDEAREASADAAQSQHHTDSVDRGKRNDIADTGGTLMAGYNGASDAVDNVNSIIDHTQQLNETENDIDDYEDYEKGSK